MLFMKVGMVGTQKCAMPLSFSNFDFLPIYMADSVGSRTYPFINLLTIQISSDNLKREACYFTLMINTFQHMRLIHANIVPAIY